MANSAVIIDPATGERVDRAPQIDPATGERISAQPQQPTATVGASPSRGVTGYLQDAEKDLTQGGSRTIIGKGLGYLQGGGDKGYSGLNSGVSPEQAQAMGSVPLGLTTMAIGASKGPVKGAPDMAAGALQASTLPTSFVAPEASQAAGELAQAGSATVAGKVLPSAMKANAAGLLQSVAHDANAVPVQLQNAGDAALRLMDWQKKTQLGPTINKFLNRITNPKMGPLNYEDARDFYQLLGRLSVDETNRLAPPVRRDLVQMVVGLKQDIGDAADTVGKAADYYQGMGEYAKASRLQDWYDLAKKYAINTGLGAVGAGGVATLLHYIEQGRK
jgi:hypothetical protein